MLSLQLIENSRLSLRGCGVAGRRWAAKGTLPNLPFVRELSEITINCARINHGRSVLICGRREINFEAKAQDPRTPGLGSCEYCIPLSPSVQNTGGTQRVVAGSRVCATRTRACGGSSTCPFAPARLEHARAYERTRRRIARVLSTMFLDTSRRQPREARFTRAPAPATIIGPPIPRRIYVPR